MRELWAVEHLFESGAVDRAVADLVERLVFSVDVEDASRLAIQIELEVAPPRGGLDPRCSGVVLAVIGGLPVMGASVHWCAVSLLNQVAGSLLAIDAGVEHEMVRALVGALPGVATLTQNGDDDMRAAFVDFAASCAVMDRSVVGQVRFYLQRLVDEVGGPIGASAQLELEQLAL